MRRPDKRQRPAPPSFREHFYADNDLSFLHARIWKQVRARQAALQAELRRAKIEFERKTREKELRNEIEAQKQRTDWLGSEVARLDRQLRLSRAPFLTRLFRAALKLVKEGHLGL